MNDKQKRQYYDRHDYRGTNAMGETVQRAHVSPSEGESGFGVRLPVNESTKWANAAVCSRNSHYSRKVAMLARKVDRFIAEGRAGKSVKKLYTSPGHNPHSGYWRGIRECVKKLYTVKILYTSSKGDSYRRRDGH